MKISHGFRRCQTFKRVKDTIGDKAYTYRSMFERNWARYLQLLKDAGQIKDWFYEPTTFDFDGYKNKPHSYTPDFKVIGIDGEEWFEELKGQLATKDLSKYRRLSEHYPDVIIEVVMQRIPKSGAGFEVFSKLKAKEGGQIRRVVDSTTIFKQVKGLI